MDIEQQRKDAVDKAYEKRALEERSWPNKYNIGAQLAKLLSDYTLLDKISLIDKKVLNIGCFLPVDEIFWASIVKEWHALDINETAIKVARDLASDTLAPQLFSKLQFIVGDTLNLNLDDEYYDVVTSFSTIDHIPGHENRMKAIGEMSRVLRPMGYMVITVPNRWNLVYAHRSNKLQRDGAAGFGYEYQFSPLELRNMMSANGLTIISYASTAFYPKSYFNRFLRKVRLDKTKVFFGARFGYLAQKQELES